MAFIETSIKVSNDINERYAKEGQSSDSPWPNLAARSRAAARMRASERESPSTDHSLLFYTQFYFRRLMIAG